MTTTTTAASTINATSAQIEAPIYAVLSLREIEEMLRIAKANARARYPKAKKLPETACIILRGSCSSRYQDEGMLQVQLQTAERKPLWTTRND